MNFKKITLIFLFLFSLGVQANSMRRCMVLPIKDNLGGALGYKVFEEVESYLRDSQWCYYTSNSEILNILANYKKNLDTVLENPKVLKIISEKTQTGSLIKVKVINEVKGVTVSIEVLGENGEDIYFKESTKLNTDEYKVIAQAVKNWLVIYEKQIPYDGKVTGVLGNQFTIDVGTNRGLFQGNDLLVIRPMGKKNHPLLKEIVDWDTEKLGEAKVIHSSESQAQGNMTAYATKRKIRLGDWVLLSRDKRQSVIEQKQYEDQKGYEFGKLGEFGLFFNVGKGSAAAELPDNKKVGGTVLGIDLKSTLWITRQYWVGLDISKVGGGLSTEEGTLANGDNDMSNTLVDFKAGYKYLPMGFFYGPQVDAFFGYGSYTYSLDTSEVDGMTEVSFKGLLIGARGSVPLQNMLRFHMELSLLFSPGFDESANVYGEADSARNYNIELGTQYLYAPNMTFDVSYAVNSSKASFTNPVRSITVKQSTLKLGTTFTF